MLALESTIDSKKLGHECRMIDAGFPFFASEERHDQTFWLLQTGIVYSNKCLQHVGRESSQGTGSFLAAAVCACLNPRSPKKWWVSLAGGGIGTGDSEVCQSAQKPFCRKADEFTPGFFGHCYQACASAKFRPIPLDPKP